MADATELGRPEDVEAIGTTLYVHNTGNLAQSSDGLPWIVEGTPSDVRVADHDKDKGGSANDVTQFAPLVDSGAEISGICFGKDPRALCCTVRHPDRAQADGV